MHVPVISELSLDSNYPVQSSVIAQAIEEAVQRGRELAKRDLYIAAGALYNDTDEVIKRTAFWGEEVEHLPEHYYLNGLGDITEEEMAYIYQHKEDITHLIASGTNGGRMFQDGFKLRTMFGAKKGNRWTCNRTIASTNPFANCDNLEVIKWTHSNSDLAPNYSATECIKTSSDILFNCTKLRVIDKFMPNKDCDFSSYYKFPKGEELRLYSLNYNINISKSPNISKNTILYAINNVLKTSSKTITITLHPTVYEKCIEGGEWYEEIQTALNTVNGYVDSEGNQVSGTITGGGSINLVTI